MTENGCECCAELAAWAHGALALARTRLAEAQRNGREVTAASEGERVASMLDVLGRLGFDYDEDAP